MLSDAMRLRRGGVASIWNDRAMANHPDAQLGIAMLTARMSGDQDAFNAITSDMPEGYAVALLLRTAEMMVNMISDLTQTTKEEALQSVAAALAAKM
ncbi:hypothetical protein [Promicromonospora soli]